MTFKSPGVTLTELSHSLGLSSCKSLAINCNSRWFEIIYHNLYCDNISGIWQQPALMQLCCGREKVTSEVRPSHLSSSQSSGVTRGRSVRLTSTGVGAMGSAMRTRGSMRSSSPAAMTGSSSGVCISSCKQRMQTQEQVVQLWPGRWETYPHADWSNTR